MSEPTPPTDVSISPEQPAGGKTPWRPPTLEEVEYSATEASGVGGVYDFTVYSGSTGP